MAITSFLLAASGLLALTSGAPIGTRSTAASPRSLVERSYAIFAGDGTQRTGWPHKDDWMSFDQLWTANQGLMKSSCSQFGVPDNTDEEIANIREAIVEAAKGGVPEAFIFAVMMQESKGCVRAPTTNWGVRNPGLMQDHDGSHTCNEGGVQSPCPKDQIFGMIDDGANGTPAGDGLKQTLAQAGSDETGKWYRAARIYNSGRVTGDNLGHGVATHCYSSDIANRLTGWVTGPSNCKEEEIGNIAMSEGFDRNKQISPPSNEEPTPSASPSSFPTPTETPVVKQPPTPEQPSSTSSPSAPTPTAPSTTYPTAPVDPVKPITPPAPTTTPIAKPGDAKSPTDSVDENAPVPEAKGEHYPGASAGCKTWYTVKKNDYCQKVEQGLNIPEGTLVKLNTGLSPDCLNLWLDYSYCVGV